MIVGDSFSVFDGGYVQYLRDSLPYHNVRNFSVPGTSIREQYLFGRHHLKRESPKTLIFQFYVGNDFFGWNHHYNWEDISLPRNCYWWLSEHFWSLAYINYWAAGLFPEKAKKTASVDSLDTPFSKANYTRWDKQHFLAEPSLIENVIYLSEGRENDFDSYMNRVRKLFNYAPSDCKIYFLIIPHPSQVSIRYKENSEQLGAKFSPNFIVNNSSYPLYCAIENYFSSDKRITILKTEDIFSNAENNGMRVFFNNDSHLNLNGQLTLGRFLLNNLEVR